MTIDGAKVAIYIRWSTDDQSSGTTLDVQRDACRFYAMSQGWQVPDDRILVDDGYSGSDLNRPGMARLRELIRRKQIECVVVYKIDRLSRNIVDATNLVLREWAGMCHLRCVMQPIDTTTELGKMIFSVLAMFADFERATIKERTFSGKVKRAAQGRNPGVMLPYGYEQGPATGEILRNDAQAALVRRIYELYAAGTGMPTIARILNAEGVPGIKVGRGWGMSTLQYLLRNPTYTGDLVYGRTRRNEKHGKAEGEATRANNVEPLAIAQGALPVIVERELWERCQRLRTQRGAVVARSGGRSVGGDHLLTGIATCTCGYALRAKIGDNKLRTVYYSCPARYQKGLEVCSAGHIPSDRLDGIVIAELLGKRNPAVLAAVECQRLAQVEERRHQSTVSLAEMELRLKGLDAEEARMRREFRAGQLEAGMFQSLIAEIGQERAETTTRQERVRVALAEQEAVSQEHLSVRMALSQLDRWDDMTVPQRKQLLRELIVRLVAFKPVRGRELTVELEWRAGLVVQ